MLPVSQTKIYDGKWNLQISKYLSAENRKYLPISAR